jgi:molybdopterin molybdotransferase
MWFGVGTRGQPIFALPGNPVSVLVGTTRYVLPALRAAAGLAPQPAERVTLAEPAEAFADLTHFAPVKLDWSPEGKALATPCRTNTSGDFLTLAGTHGFVELPPQRTDYSEGTAVRLFRW